MEVGAKVTPQRTAEPEKEKPVPRKRPDRRRPKSNLDEAQKFIEIAIAHQTHIGVELTANNVDVLRRLFHNYAHNTGLRGKQKDSIWRIVQAEIHAVKAEEHAESKR